MLKHTEEAPQRTSKKKLHTDEEEEEEEEEALPTWHSHELGTRRYVPLN
jgi:hypothetical protein